MKDEKLQTMMKQAEPVFKEIDKIGEELRKNSMSKDIEFYSKRLDVLTGCFTYIAPRYSRLSAEHKNAKLAKYMEIKVETEAEGKKFVDAPTSKAADAHVAKSRVVRNLFDGYMKVAESAINTCKLQIKRIQGENSAE